MSDGSPPTPRARARSPRYPGLVVAGLVGVGTVTTSGCGGDVDVHRHYEPPASETAARRAAAPGVATPGDAAGGADGAGPAEELPDPLPGGIPVQ